MALNVYGFGRLFKQIDAQAITNLRYTCCLLEINESLTFVLFNYSDVMENSSPFICVECRQFSVGQFKVQNQHSIKLSEYRNNRLCKFLLPSGNECLITATQNKDPRCSLHNPVKKRPKSSVGKEISIDSEGSDKKRKDKEGSDKKRKNKECGYHLTNNGSIIHCTVKPFFGWPQGPKKIFRFCEVHAEIGEIISILITLLIIFIYKEW